MPLLGIFNFTLPDEQISEVRWKIDDGVLMAENSIEIRQLLYNCHGIMYETRFAEASKQTSLLRNWIFLRSTKFKIPS